MTKQSRVREDVAFVIPVYNEEKVIQEVVKKVLKKYKYVICINDGSRDNSAHEIAKTDAILINHPINMGQGAALQTGIEFARDIDTVNYLVTYDADGQHDLDDVANMLEIIEKSKVDMVLGSRFMGEAINIKPIKKIVLKMAVLFTNITTGLKLTDAHNGLRVFTKDAAKRIQITMPDMAHASEILSIIKRENISFVEAPVTIHYTDYSMSKGQSVFNAINIVFDMTLKGKK